MTTKKQHFWIDREHERAPVDIPCRLEAKDATGGSGSIINLSAGGLKFGCNRDVFNLLIPEDQRVPGLVNDVEIELVFQLPDTDRDQPRSIRTRARIIHTERLAQDRYTLGIQYLDLDAADTHAIKYHIQAVLASRVRP